jgi:restriction system protein
MRSGRHSSRKRKPKSEADRTPAPILMPIPPFPEMLLPLLRRSADGREWTVAALRGTIADDFSLTAERQELLPSNTQFRFVNRLCWAKIYLERAGLITRVRRGVFTISDAGRAVLAENPAAITLAYLDRFESFRKFRETRTRKWCQPPNLGKLRKRLNELVT